MYPENWPSDIRYLSQIDWADTSLEQAKQFKEELSCNYFLCFFVFDIIEYDCMKIYVLLGSEYVNICSIKNTDTMVLLSKSEFPEGSWLDQVTGRIVQRTILIMLSVHLSLRSKR